MSHHGERSGVWNRSIGAAPYLRQVLSRRRFTFPRDGRLWARIVDYQGPSIEGKWSDIRSERAGQWDQFHDHASHVRGTFENGADCLDDRRFVTLTPTHTSSPKVRIDKDLGLDLGRWADHGWVAEMG